MMALRVAVSSMPAKGFIALPAETAIHRRGIGETFRSACFPADDAMQVGAKPVVAFFHGMASAARGVEGRLAINLICGVRCGVGRDQEVRGSAQRF